MTRAAIRAERRAYGPRYLPPQGRYETAICVECGGEAIRHSESGELLCAGSCPDAVELCECCGEWPCPDSDFCEEMLS